MGSRCFLFLIICFAGASVHAAGRGLTDTSASPHVKLRSVDINAVRWTDGFWAERFDWCRRAVIPNMWRLLDDPNISHAYENFLVAAGLKEGRHRGPKWHDGDFFKWLEAVAFVYATTRDEDLDRQMDAIIEVIGKVQREDGYIHTPAVIAQRQHLPQADEFRDRLDFETYNMGHLMTCACTHYRATGKTNLLDIAKKAADFLYRTYKDSPDTLAGNAICPSHYMGVVEIYRTTGDPKYLELARGLIDIRDRVKGGTDDNQDRIPFRQQMQAVGHAVRANYLYAGAADVYAETGDSSLLDALEKIWRDVALRKIYVTGATGALYNGASPDGSKAQSSIQPVHQAYGRAYQLPNIAAHNESCATVGFILWNWRMLAITGEARFADSIELSLYNALLSSISLDGKEFFYTNPLARVDDLPFELRWSRKREPYISCFCCPPNVVRTIAETAAYAYSVSHEGVWVNLYGGNVLDTRLPGGGAVTLRQQTRYPWEGTIRITLDSVPPTEFSLFLRIPGWADDARVAINGKPTNENLESGRYFEIRRSWSAGDQIELLLPMPVQFLEAHPLVEEARNQVAVRRGPIVYCLESVDLPRNVKLANVAVSPDRRFAETPDLAGLPATEVVLEGKVCASAANSWDDTLYRKVSPEEPTMIDVRLIPYYAWGNRGDSEMAVWMPLVRVGQKDSMLVLDAGTFKHHVDFFNGMEPENIVNYVPNRESWAWMKDNVPFFECPDKSLEQIYYFRWWTFRKHLKKTPDGFVFTEFLDKVGHSGKHNTISCALGHHIYEGAWLRDKRYIDEYARFWYMDNERGLQPHLRKYSNWATWALYRRYLVDRDAALVTSLLDAFIADYQGWVQEHGAENGLFWQYDVRDGMEESISGGRKVQNIRPPLNCYMYANALAISKVAQIAGRDEVAGEYAEKASRLKSLIHGLLWDDEAKFFKVRRPDGGLADVREEIGFIPWYFDLAEPGCEQAWQQFLDPQGFAAPMGITTAERRHPQFRSHGVGTCEWDGAVWPYATSQTLTGLANVLHKGAIGLETRHYFEALLTYARSHQYRGKPYIGEYLDEQNGTWLKPDSDRSRYYNHSTFCDLVITGLVGLVPREDDAIVVDPLVPADTWDWFCLDNVPYHGRTLTILWDRTGDRYRRGAGLRAFADRVEIARSDALTRVTGKLP